jgi:hypothetical protein
MSESVISRHSDSSLKEGENALDRERSMDWLLGEVDYSDISGTRAAISEASQRGEEDEEPMEEDETGDITTGRLSMIRAMKSKWSKSDISIVSRDDFCVLIMSY